MSWYHGSPLQLTYLLPGSTITQNEALARIFSHKPPLVSIADDGTIRHNGTQPGFLYIIDEPVSPEDVYPHPRSSMPPEWEWLTRRALRVRLLGPVEITPDELLSEDELAEIYRRMKGA